LGRLSTVIKRAKEREAEQAAVIERLRKDMEAIRAKLSTPAAKAPVAAAVPGETADDVSDADLQAWLNGDKKADAPAAPAAADPRSAEIQALHKRLEELEAVTNDFQGFKQAQIELRTQESLRTEINDARTSYCPDVPFKAFAAAVKVRPDVDLYELASLWGGELKALSTSHPEVPTKQLAALLERDPRVDLTAYADAYMAEVNRIRQGYVRAPAPGAQDSAAKVAPMRPAIGGAPAPAKTAEEGPATFDDANAGIAKALRAAFSVT